MLRHHNGLWKNLHLQQQSKAEILMSGELKVGHILRIVSSQRNHSFRIMSSSYRINSYFSLAFTHGLILAGLYKGKENYESKHTDVLSWFGYTAVLQLQSAHRYDDRAGDLSCLGANYSTSPDTRCMPFKAPSPAGAAKTSQPWEELCRTVPGQGPADGGSRWSRSRVPSSKSCQSMCTMIVV